MIDEIAAENALDLKKLSVGSSRIGKQAFALTIPDFYLSNPIARASAIMGELSAMKSGGASKATGTDG